MLFKVSTAFLSRIAASFSAVEAVVTTPFLLI